MRIKQLISDQNKLQEKINIVQSALDELANYELVSEENDRFNVLVSLTSITNKWGFIDDIHKYKGFEIAFFSNGLWSTFVEQGGIDYVHVCKYATTILEESLSILLSDLSEVNRNIKPLLN